MLPSCRHILTSGRKCESIALRRKNFCYHHDKLHIERRNSALRSQIKTQTYDHGTMLVPDASEPNPPYPVSVEFPEEPAAILTNIYRVTNLLIRGQIDRPTANSVTYGMQVCLSALNGKPLLAPSPAPSQSTSRSHDTDSGDSESTSDPSTPATPVSHPVHRVILTPDGDEIAPPVEILEENEAEPIHHKGCPCLLCAEKYRNQLPEEHHPNCQCGLCEEQSAEHSAQSTELHNEGAPLYGISSRSSRKRNRGPRRARSWRVGAGSERRVEGLPVRRIRHDRGCPIFGEAKGGKRRGLFPQPCAARPGRSPGQSGSPATGPGRRGEL